jgi:chemotaxis protein CheD
MSLVVVGIGDCQVSANPRETLVTYALGSCIAVLAHDPVTKVGGLLHYMLPHSTLNTERARTHPAVFGDTGIELLIQMLLRKGVQLNRLVLRIAGGAQVMDDRGVFNIGKRNQLVLRKDLWSRGLIVSGEETGGTVARTVRLDVGTGRTFLRAGHNTEREWILAHQPMSYSGGAL